jgi:hypothetical protein
MVLIVGCHVHERRYFFNEGGLREKPSQIQIP